MLYSLYCDYKYYKLADKENKIDSDYIKMNKLDRNCDKYLVCSILIMVLMVIIS